MMLTFRWFLRQLRCSLLRGHQFYKLRAYDLYEEERVLPHGTAPDLYAHAQDRVRLYHRCSRCGLVL